MERAVGEASDLARAGPPISVTVEIRLHAGQTTVLATCPYRGRNRLGFRAATDLATQVPVWRGGQHDTHGYRVRLAGAHIGSRKGAVPTCPVPQMLCSDAPRRGRSEAGILHGYRFKC